MDPKLKSHPDTRKAAGPNSPRIRIAVVGAGYIASVPANRPLPHAGSCARLERAYSALGIGADAPIPAVEMEGTSPLVFDLLAAVGGRAARTA